MGTFSRYQAIWSLESQVRKAFVFVCGGGYNVCYVCYKCYSVVCMYVGGVYDVYMWCVCVGGVIRDQSKHLIHAGQALYV